MNYVLGPSASLSCSHLLDNKLPNLESCISYQLTDGYLTNGYATLRCILIPSDVLLLTKFVIVAVELPMLIPLT